MFGSAGPGQRGDHFAGDEFDADAAASGVEPQNPLCVGDRHPQLTGQDAFSLVDHGVEPLSVTGVHRAHVSPRLPRISEDSTAGLGRRCCQRGRPQGGSPALPTTLGKAEQPFATHDPAGPSGACYPIWRPSAFSQ
jgi:hypothetical protein